MGTRSIHNERVFSTGRLDDISDTIRRTRGITAVFMSSNHLSPAQLLFLQQTWKVPVFDRYDMPLQYSFHKGFFVNGVDET